MGVLKYKQMVFASMVVSLGASVVSAQVGSVGNRNWNPVMPVIPSIENHIVQAGTQKHLDAGSIVPIHQTPSTGVNAVVPVGAVSNGKANVGVGPNATKSFSPSEQCGAGYSRACNPGKVYGQGAQLVEEMVRAKAGTSLQNSQNEQVQNTILQNGAVGVGDVNEIAKKSYVDASKQYGKIKTYDTVLGAVGMGLAGALYKDSVSQIAARLAASGSCVPANSQICIAAATKIQADQRAVGASAAMAGMGMLKSAGEAGNQQKWNTQQAGYMQTVIDNTLPGTETAFIDAPTPVVTPDGAVIPPAGSGDTGILGYDPGGGDNPDPLFTPPAGGAPVLAAAPNGGASGASGGGGGGNASLGANTNEAEPTSHNLEMSKGASLSQGSAPKTAALGGASPSVDFGSSLMDKLFGKGAEDKGAPQVGNGIETYRGLASANDGSVLGPQTNFFERATKVLRAKYDVGAIH